MFPQGQAGIRKLCKTSVAGTGISRESWAHAMAVGAQAHCSDCLSIPMILALQGNNIPTSLEEELWLPAPIKSWKFIEIADTFLWFWDISSTTSCINTCQAILVYATTQFNINFIESLGHAGIFFVHTPLACMYSAPHGGLTAWVIFAQHRHVSHNLGNNTCQLGWSSSYYRRRAFSQRQLLATNSNKSTIRMV